MGKEGELWDDSALIKAFDSAISKFKVMHGKSGGEEKAIVNTEENLPGIGADNESIEFVQNDDSLSNGLETTTKVVETAESLVSTEDSPLELGSSAKCVALPNTQERHVPPTNDISSTTSVSQGENTVFTDLKDQNEAACYLNGSEEYSKLLSKYYEVENQRQHILQQLNEYSNWSHQYPVTGTSAAEEYQASVQQPYEAVACDCAYGCQNWVAPCDSTAAASSGVKYTDTTSHAKGSPNGNSGPKKDPDFVKMAMAAAEKALSLTNQANGGTCNQLGMETQSAMDLDMVLSAWYTAGFYTGKYVSEQSSERSKEGGGF